VICFTFNTEDVCEPCQHRNITVTATKYCDECEEKYCESCALSHMVQKRTKAHKIVDITKEIIVYGILTFSWMCVVQHTIHNMVQALCNQDNKIQLQYHCLEHCMFHRIIVEPNF
jgi:hypothetical protein